MTQAQKILYFHLWGAAVKACGWRMHEGRLQNADPAQAQTVEHASVLASAHAQAERRSVAPVVDDIRHAVCFVATEGRVSSSAKLTNKQLTRVLILLRLLADPDDLTARMQWDNPEMAEADALRAVIAQSPDDYVASICMDRFGTRVWRGLVTPDLRWLAGILAQRRRAGNGLSESVVDDPF